MAKKRLSVVLATHNEEQNIARCLESVKHIADEIVVVDGASEDATVAIAKKYKARVIVTTNPPNFHINKRKAIDAAVGEWIFQLDADEVVTPELAAEVLTETSKDHSELCGYWIPRSNFFLNRFLTKGGQYPDYTLRLYKKLCGTLPAQDVHEQAKVSGPVGHLTNNLLHYGDTNFDKYLVRLNRYTDLIAKSMATDNVKIHPLSTFNFLFIKPLTEFLFIYLRHRGYVDGFAGFVFALFSGLRFPISYIKLWQITKSV